MNALRTILVIGVCGAMLTGCGKEEETTPTTPATGEGMAAGSKTAEEIGSAVGEAAEKVGEEAMEALEAFKAEYGKQLDSHEAKLATLKTGAKAFDDQKLNGLIGDLDTQLATARGKLGEMSGTDVGTTAALKQELTGLMNEIPKLYEQAMARFDEVKGAGLPELPEGGELPDLPGR